MKFIRHDTVHEKFSKLTDTQIMRSILLAKISYKENMGKLS